MSHYSYLMCCVTAEVSSPVRFPPSEADPQFFAQSRNAWFQQTCKRLLDTVAVGDDVRFTNLRFLSGETYTSTDFGDGSTSSGQHYAWTVIEPADLPELSRVLSEVIALSESDPHRLVWHVFKDYGQVDVAEVTDAIAAAQRLQITDSVDGSDENDRPQFLFNVLRRMQQFVDVAIERQHRILYINNRPE